MTWILINSDGETREFDNRADAEQQKAELEGIGGTLELVKQDGNQLVTVEAADEPAKTDSEEITDDDLETDHEIAEAVNTANEISRANKQEQTPRQPDTADEITNGGDNELPDAPDVSEDPISWMPEHFVDTIEGVPAINRKGYAVLAKHYDIIVSSEPITYPGESEWEYAEFSATATTPEGDVYTGYGSAHVDRGDDKTVLGELAETRACKRSIAWATGVGMVAVSELSNEVVE